MKRTIIYVFGPTRLSAQYYSNTKLNLDDGGWLKIGQTSEEDDNVSKWDSALKRIGQESRTGLPEVCRLFDVFEYPAQAGKTDDKVRKLLTEDIYCLECSAAHNKEIEKREIKAGCEFVYGITRSQVLNAVVKFEHNLILENYGKEGFEELMEMIQGNNDFDEIPFEPNPDEESDNAESTATSDDKTKWCNNLWDKVIEKIKGEISVNISNPKGRPYINFKSANHDGFFYDCGYSIRYGLATVSFATLGGSVARDNMEKLIASNNLHAQLPDLMLRQGAKNEEKWSWSVSDTLSKSDDELINWFANTILSFYKTFERV